jgi:hypothetical protein
MTKCRAEMRAGRKMVPARRKEMLATRYLLPESRKEITAGRKSFLRAAK